MPRSSVAPPRVKCGRNHSHASREQARECDLRYAGREALRLVRRWALRGYSQEAGSEEGFEEVWRRAFRADEDAGAQTAPPAERGR